MEEKEVGVTLWGLGRIQGTIKTIFFCLSVLNIIIAPVNDFSLEMRNILFQSIEGIINSKLSTLQQMTIVDKNVDDNEDVQSNSSKNARLKAFKRLISSLDAVGVNFKQLDIDTQKKLLAEALK